MSEPTFLGLPQAASWLWWDKSLFAQGQLWRVLTHLFVHADAAHLLANALSAWALGCWHTLLRASWRMWASVGAAYLCLVLPWSGPAWGASGLLHGWTMALIWLSKELGLRGQALIATALCTKVALEATVSADALAWGLHLSGCWAGLMVAAACGRICPQDSASRH